MKLCVAVACAVALASVRADDLGGLVYAPGHASPDYYAYPSYAFEYAVKDPHTGDNKAQWEKRDGDVVKGAYSLVEPDGSVRIVEYYADDKSGFNAVVKRVGPNLHPATVHAAPIYKAPIPVIGAGAIAPISVGSIAKYNGLADAPLITGPIHGGAVSSAALYKSAPIVKIPEPYIPAPIIKSAPILSAPLPYSAAALPSPIYKTAPIYSEPLYKSGPNYPEPIYKSAPIYSAPIYKSVPTLVPAPVYPPLYKSGPIISPPLDLGYGGGLIKGPIGPISDLGQGLLAKGLLSGWGGPYSDYDLGLKH